MSMHLMAAVGAAAAVSQELPPISQDLLGITAVSCVKVSGSGKIVGAYLIQATGDANRDRQILAWIRKLHWDPAKPGEKMRNVWFPMPIAFGDVPVPAAPSSCRRNANTPAR